jgi:hypothetical protein
MVRGTLLLRSLPRSPPTEPSNIALALVREGRFADPYIVSTGFTAHSTPFFPALIAAIYWLFGTGDAGDVARSWLNVGAYACLYAALPFLARGLDLPVAAGVLAGLAFALAPLKRIAEIFLSFEEPFAALAMGGLGVLSYQLWKKREIGMREAAVYGAAWAAALYISLSLAPVMIGWLIAGCAAAKGRRRTMLRSALVSLAVTLTLLAPWSVRNGLRVGTWMLRGNLGLELYISNAEAADASARVNLESSWHGHAHPFLNELQALEVRRLGEARYNRERLAAALEWIRHNPGRFLQLTAQRFLYFWSGPFPLEWPTSIANGLLTVLAVAGLVCLFRRGLTAQAVLFSVALLTYPVVYYLVQHSPRYTVPVYWIVGLAAGWLVYMMRVTILTARKSPLPQP